MRAPTIHPSQAKQEENVFGEKKHQERMQLLPLATATNKSLLGVLAARPAISNLPVGWNKQKPVAGRALQHYE
jgi:hypothetical protein